MIRRKYKTRIEYLEGTVSRFWSHVDRKGPNDCWEWQGTMASPNKCGQRYGSFGTTKNGRGFGIRAHRFAWMLLNGSIPDGYVVMHHCDNPACVNPNHLSAATQAENLADRDRKGRTQRGERQWNSRFTEADIIEIRNDTRPIAVIAEDRGCDYTHILRIQRGDCWKHVPMPDTPVHDDLTQVNKSDG